MSISDGYWRSLIRGALEATNHSFCSIIGHSGDGDRVNQMLWSFWIGELEGNGEGEVKACEGDEIEEEGCEEGLEDAVNDACTCVLEVSLTKAEVDISRRYVNEFLWWILLIGLIGISLGLLGLFSEILFLAWNNLCGCCRVFSLLLLLQT